jgi:hypothetical protein
MCGGLTRVLSEIAVTNAALTGSGLPRVYTASGRRTGGSGRSTMPSNRAGITLPGTSVIPIPASA